MKKLIILLVSIILVSCNTIKKTTEKTLSDCKTIEDYRFDGFYIIKNDTLRIAYLKSIEYAYDNDELVYEASIILLHPKYSSDALCILATIHKRKPTWDIEVELENRVKVINR